MEFIIALFLTPINDITTSFSEPPAFRAGLTYNEKFAEVQKRIHPEVQPKEVNDSAMGVFEKVKQTALSEGWEITVLDEDKFHLEAVATTPTMGFKDDIAIDVRPSPTGAVVHMRSRSRTGKSDLGTNAKRIVSFLKKI